LVKYDTQRRCDVIAIVMAELYVDFQLSVRPEAEIWKERQNNFFEIFL